MIYRQICFIVSHITDIGDANMLTSEPYLTNILSYTLKRFKMLINICNLCAVAGGVFTENVENLLSAIMIATNVKYVLFSI